MYYATGLTGWQRAAQDASAATPAPAPAVSEKVELQSLRERAAAAAAELDQLRRRIEEIAAAKTANAEGE